MNVHLPKRIQSYSLADSGFLEGKSIYEEGLKSVQSVLIWLP